MKNLLLYILIFKAYSTIAQSNNFWNVMDYSAITFQNNQPSASTQSLRSFSTSSICNSRGNVILYNDYNKIYDGNHNLIINGTLTPYCISASLIISTNDSTFYLLQNNYSDLKLSSSCKSNGGLLYTIIKRKKGVFYVNPSEKQVLLKKGKMMENVPMVAVSRKDDGMYYLAGGINDTAFVYSLDTTITLKSALPLANFYSLAPCANPVNCDMLQDLMLVFNHSGNKLYSFFYERLNVNNHLGKNVNILIANSTKIVAFDFDKLNGLMINPSIIYSNPNFFKNYPNITINDTFKYEEINQNPCISLDDRFLYINSFKYYQKLYKNGSSSQDNDTILIKQVDLSNKTVSTVSVRNLSTLRLLKQSPDGRIFSYFRSFGAGGPIFESDVIQFPNKGGGSCLYQSNVYKIQMAPTTYPQIDRTSYHLHDFIRLSYKVVYDCEAKVQFVNNSFNEIQFNNFTWYITKPNGEIDTLQGNNPTVLIGKSGKFPYRVFAHSSTKKYGEWFQDTLYISIPEKPVANFQTVDTTVCRFLPVHFKNLSYSKSVGINSNYLWTFGDGSITSNSFEPAHTYTKPGIYTVSLFYTNGYCDSTLVKNQYIRVVDAPKPGFNVLNSQGCSPFQANFTDTVSLNVTKKEYLFSDSSIWRIISTPKFSYIFQKPGIYWAVQKLYGYTGCIIRTDSIKFFISKGLLPSDSIRIVSASFDTSNTLQLVWQSNSAAVKYEVLKSFNGTNFSSLQQTSNTIFTDKSKPMKNTYYKVRAIDSCGSFSSSSNIISPSFISCSNINKNESAELNYVLAQGFGISIDYELFGGFNNYSNLKKIQTNPLNPFIDNKFSEVGYLRKCYRLKSDFSGYDMFSNSICIDYEPLIFIANAFTPNANGLNDQFSPLGLGIVSYTMSIYNRWGERVFSGATPWDGKVNNEDVMDDIYFYIITITENTRNVIHRSGSVRVLR